MRPSNADVGLKRVLAVDQVLTRCGLARAPSSLYQPADDPTTKLSGTIGEPGSFGAMPDRETSPDPSGGRHRRQWRDYRTRSGRRVVREEIMALPTPERAVVTAAMADVAKNGKKAARHLRGEIFEVRAEGVEVTYRLLFASEGRYSQMLLGLAFFTKKTRRTPPAQIELAEQRLADWRSRGSP